MAGAVSGLHRLAEERLVGCGAADAWALHADVLCGKHELQAADVSLAGGGARKPLQGEVQGAGSDNLNVIRMSFGRYYNGRQIPKNRGSDR